MNVRELIEQLSDKDPDAEVIFRRWGIDWGDHDIEQDIETVLEGTVTYGWLLKDPVTKPAVYLE